MGRDLFDGRLEGASQTRFTNQLTDVVADHVHTQDFAVLRIRDDLNEAFIVGRGYGATVRGQWKLSYLHLMPRRLRLLLGKADHGNLGMAVADARNVVIAHRMPGHTGDTLSHHDSLVRALMSEHRFSGNIAASPDERMGPATETKSSRPFAGWVPWLLAAALGMVVIGLLLRGATSTETVPTRRFALDLPWQNMPNWGDFRVRISQQGTHLAYPGSDENRTTIYLRPLDSLDAITLVSPAADPWSLAFSPNGEQLAFFTGRHLQAVSIHGGRPEPIGEFSEEQFVGDISWGSDGSILLGGLDGLTRVRTSDGGSDLLVAARNEMEVYLHPFHLPDAQHALVSISGQTSAPSRPAQSSTGRLAVVALDGGTVRELTFQGVEPIYSPMPGQ